MGSLDVGRGEAGQLRYQRIGVDPIGAHDTSHDLAHVQALDLRALNPRLPDERLVQEGLPVLDHEGARYLPLARFRKAKRSARKYTDV